MKKEFIPLDEPLLNGNEKKYLNDCIDSGWVSWQGKYVKKLEEKLAEYCDTKHCLTTVNGTYALVTALQVLGIGRGDEVIVPTLSMSACAFAPTTLGAEVVWADSEKNSFVIDPQDVEKRITDKTKAVMAVHLYGQPVDMDSLLKITKPKRIPIIEDCAEALGAIINRRKIGGLGEIACHSFHNKIIASGEGGAITTNNSELEKKLQELRTPPPNNYGFEGVVLNNRMSNLNAAVALAQLERIEELVEKRRDVAKLYDKYFENNPSIEIIKERNNERFVYWRYQIILKKSYSFSGEELVKKLKKNNVEARKVFSLMHEHPYYKNKKSDYYKNAQFLSRSGIDLPSSPNLKEKQIEKIARLVLKHG